MLEFLAHLIVTATLLLLVSHLVRGVEIEGWGSALIAALVLGLVNGSVKPIIVFLTLPLTLLTLGLFLLVVDKYIVRFIEKPRLNQLFSG